VDNTRILPVLTKQNKKKIPNFACRPNKTPNSMGETKVLVSNLGPEVDDEDLVNLFQEAAVLKTAEVFKKADGTSTGTGEVVFMKREDAVKAIASLQGHPLDGKMLQLALVGVQPAFFVTGVNQPPAWGREDGVICLECLLTIPCDCPPGSGTAEAAAAALRGMSTKEVVQLFQKVLQATTGQEAASAFDVAVKNKPKLRCVGGAMLSSRVFATALQTIIKETLTDDTGGEGLASVVGQVLHAYTQALCAAVQPPPMAPAAPQAAPSPDAHHPPVPDAGAKLQEEEPIAPVVVEEAAKKAEPAGVPAGTAATEATSSSRDCRWQRLEDIRRSTTDAWRGSAASSSADEEEGSRGDEAGGPAASVSLIEKRDPAFPNIQPRNF